MREEAASQKIGTTKRGIGPAYEDKVGRRALRAIDLKDPASLPAKIERLLAHHNVLRKGFGHAEVDAGALLQGADRDRAQDHALPGLILARAGRRASAPASACCSKAPRRCCWTSTMAPIPSSPPPTRWRARRRRARAFRPREIGTVLGIVKSYTTRVGEGPFPTELKDATGEKLGERGHEFGTVTGRKRRCGWFDAVLVRQTVHHRRGGRHRPDQAGRAGRL